MLCKRKKVASQFERMSNKQINVLVAGAQGFETHYQFAYVCKHNDHKYVFLMIVTDIRKNFAVMQIKNLFVK